MTDLGPAMAAAPASVAAIVLAGGRGRRFGGDKLAADLAGRPLLDHLLDGLPRDWTVVCVGPPRPSARPVIWVRESPTGGGPVAAIAAGMHVLPATVERVLVLAGDLPRGAEVARLLLASAGSAHGQASEALAAAADRADDEAGTRPNPLAALYPRAVLAAALPEEPTGQAARTLLAQVDLRVVRVPAPLLADVDTPEDLAAAESPIWQHRSCGGTQK